LSSIFFKNLFFFFVFLKKSDAKVHKIFYKIFFTSKFLLKSAIQFYYFLFIFAAYKLKIAYLIYGSGNQNKKGA